MTQTDKRLILEEQYDRLKDEWQQARECLAVATEEYEEAMKYPSKMSEEDFPGIYMDYTSCTREVQDLDDKLYSVYLQIAAYGDDPGEEIV